MTANITMTAGAVSFHPSRFSFFVRSVTGTPTAGAAVAVMVMVEHS
ncbi:MAG TPA: hypothetical protein VHT97_05960 [Acidimicrobiales bacterium]|nr:hypothetical protein [Acidimicrobiales bacterium]